MTIRGQKTLLIPGLQDIEDKKLRDILYTYLDMIEEMNRMLRGDVVKVVEIQPEPGSSTYIGEKVLDPDPNKPADWKDGSWRFSVNPENNRLEFQRREDGHWVYKGGLNP